VDAGSNITVGGGQSCQIIVTPGDVGQPATLLVRVVSLGELPPTTGFTYLRACEVRISSLTALAVQAQQPTNPARLAAPVEVCFTYGTSELASAGNDPTRLTVLRLVPASRTMAALPTAIDRTNLRVCTSSGELGTFALAARAGSPANLPNTSGNFEDPPPAALPAAPAAVQAPAAPTALPTMPPTTAPTTEPTTVPTAQAVAAVVEPAGAAPAAPPVVATPVVAAAQTSAPASGTFVPWWVIALVLLVMAGGGVYLARGRGAARP
jgi:hypothetical protein